MRWGIWDMLVWDPGIMGDKTWMGRCNGDVGQLGEVNQGMLDG